MTDDATDKAPEKTPDKTPEKAPESVSTPDEGKIRAVLRNMLADLGITPDGDGDGAKKDDPADVAKQVREELANVRKGESAEAERRAILDRLSKLEKSTAPESAPILHRPVERLMKWRLPDE